VQNEMIGLADSGLGKQVEGPDGTVRWAPNDAYAQAHGNKPEYTSCVHGVSKNILPVWGHIHPYYTPSQSRSQNGSAPLAVVTKMIHSTIQLKEQEHKQEIEELLAK
jgi:hypothetical protein